MKTNVRRLVRTSNFVPTIHIMDLKTQWGELYVNTTWARCSDEWRWSLAEDISVLQVHLLAPLLLWRHHHRLWRLSCWGSPVSGRLKPIILVTQGLFVRGFCSYFSILFLNPKQASTDIITTTTSPTTQVCNYGDFVDGQCLTTTVTSPATETTTAALAEDFGMNFVFGDLINWHDERSITNTIIITIW